MARKATDLLDVFRFNNEDEEDGQERKTRRKAAKRASSTARRASSTARRASSTARNSSKGASKKSTGTTFDGIHIGPRQLLLTSCAGLLLLVLSFTLGLATGRPGSAGDSTGPALTRQSLVMMLVTIPLIDPATRKKTDAARIRKMLSEEFRVPSKNIRIYEEKKTGRLALEIGPFTSEKVGNQFLRARSLDLAHINMEDPFRWVQYVPYRR